MKLKQDEDEFDNWQFFFSYELLKEIKQALEGGGIGPGHLRELTEAVGFRISSLLDWSTPFLVDGTSVTPVLTFSSEEGVLVHGGSSSELHVYVDGNADDLFDEDEDE